MAKTTSRDLIVVLAMVLLALSLPFTNLGQSKFVKRRGPGLTDQSKPVDCAATNGYSVNEVMKGTERYVDIKQGDKILKSIRIFTGIERNGFALDEAKKTKTGFEISVEYGSRYYFQKRFIFLCRQHNFYLRKVMVASFDKANPEHRWKKEIRVRPMLPLETFFLDDFMREGVVTKVRARSKTRISNQ